MTVSFGLFNAQNNHPLSYMECRNVYKEKQRENHHRHGEPEASSLHCFMSFPSNPTIYLSFTPSFPPASPPPLWVSDTQAKVCVHVPLCTSRMLLPSGGIPSAPDYVVRNEKRNLTSQVNNTHTRTHILNLNKHTICTKSQGCVSCMLSKKKKKSCLFISNEQIY